MANLLKMNWSGIMGSGYSSLLVGIKTDIIILESNLGSNYSNFKKCAPFNPAIPFLGMRPKDILTYSLQEALKNGKLPKHQ